MITRGNLSQLSPRKIQDFPPSFILTKLSVNGQFYRFSGKLLENWQKLPAYGKLPRLEISWKNFYFTWRFSQENLLSNYESWQMKKLFYFISLSMAFMLDNLGSCLQFVTQNLSCFLKRRSQLESSSIFSSQNVPKWSLSYYVEALPARVLNYV